MRIFLVAWTPFRVQTLGDLLSSVGHEVIVESLNGAVAHQMIRDLQPDLILLDGQIRASHSRALADALQKTKSTREIPVCVVDLPEKLIPVWQERVNYLQFRSEDALRRDLAGRKGQIP